MSARRIPANRRSATGSHFSLKSQKQFDFASSLEHDLMYRLDVDPDVAWFQSQPMRLAFTDDHGIQRHYKPDILVHYECRNGTSYRQLIEVKFLADLDDDWGELKDRLKGGGRYAETQGWRFDILTEFQIRDAELWNAKFLWDYCRRPQQLELQPWVLKALSRAGPTTITQFIQSLEPFARSMSSDYTIALYQLIASRDINREDDVQLHAGSVIWV